MGFQLSAPELKEIFDAVTRSLCDHLTERAEILPRESRWIEVSAENAEVLLQKWIDEQLFIFATEGTLFRHSESSLVEDAHGNLTLRGQLRGEPVDPNRHLLRLDPPTRPFPRPRLLRVPEGWRAEVEFAALPSSSAESEYDEDPLAAAGGLAGG